MKQNQKFNILLAVGQWFVGKHQRQQQQQGTRHTAEQMRKRGVPLEVALMVLTGRRSVL